MVVAIGATVNTRAGDEGVGSEAMQHEFQLCNVLEGGQQACAPSRALLAMKHTTPGIATEISAMATRPTARLCLSRTIQPTLILIRYHQTKEPNDNFHHFRL
jgi:hypothetical protein